LLRFLLGILHCLHLLAVLILLLLIALLVVFCLVVLVLSEEEVDGVGVILVEFTGEGVGLLDLGLGVEENGEDGGLLPVFLVLDL
jgi:hypothetical protein